MPDWVCEVALWVTHLPWTPMDITSPIKHVGLYVAVTLAWALVLGLKA